MLISLRTKTILLMFITLVFTAGPLMYLSLRHSEESVRKNYAMAIGDILEMAENTIKSNFAEFQRFKTAMEQAETERFESETQNAAELLRSLRAAGWSFQHCEQVLAAISTRGHIALMREDGTPWGMGLSQLPPDVRDDNGRLLPEAIRDAIRSGDKDVISFSSGKYSALVCIVPVPQEKTAVVTLTFLEPLLKLLEQNTASLGQNLKTALNSLDTLDDGVVAVFRTDTTELLIPPRKLLTREARDRIFEALNRGDESCSIPSESGPMLCYIQRMPDYRLMIVAGVAESELSDSFRELAVRQAGSFALTLLVGTLLAVLFGRHLIAPLVHLSSIVKRLPERDFTLNEPDESEELPIQRRDEIGELARSFAEMEELLRGTVSRLVQTATTKERLEGELNIAREIQEGILPKTFPPFPSRSELSLFASLLPAREIGGDLYDFFLVDDDTLCIAIGDVSGKGVPAALYMSITITLIRVAMRPGVSPEEGMSSVNEALTRGNPHGMFVSLLLGLYDLRTGELRFALGGHPPPIRVSEHGCTPLPGDDPDIVPGLVSGVVYRGFSTRLEPGEALFFYTDGVTEATSESGEFYQEARLLDTLRRFHDLSVDETVRAVLEDLLRFSGTTPQADDITMLMLRRTRTTPESEKDAQAAPAPAPAGSRAENVSK